MVYSGLIDKLKLSDAELATVIGHEMAHALREHSREAASRMRAEQGLGVLAQLAGVSASAVNIAGTLTQLTFNLPHSRVQESEADRIGLELMARAGYDPHAALSLWQKMGQASQNGTPAFLSTHPSDSRASRICTPCCRGCSRYTTPRPGTTRTAPSLSTLVVIRAPLVCAAGAARR